MNFWNHWTNNELGIASARSPCVSKNKATIFARRKFGLFLLSTANVDWATRRSTPTSKFFNRCLKREWKERNIMSFGDYKKIAKTRLIKIHIEIDGREKRWSTKNARLILQSESYIFMRSLSIWWKLCSSWLSLTQQNFSSSYRCQI